MPLPCADAETLTELRAMPISMLASDDWPNAQAGFDWTNLEIFTDSQAARIRARLADAAPLYTFRILLMCAYKHRNCSDPDEDCEGTASRLHVLLRVAGLDAHKVVYQNTRAAGCMRKAGNKGCVDPDESLREQEINLALDAMFLLWLGNKGVYITKGTLALSNAAHSLVAACYGLTQKLHGRVTNPAYLCTRSTYAQTAATPLFLQRCATPRDTVIRE